MELIFVVQLKEYPDLPFTSHIKIKFRLTKELNWKTQTKSKLRRQHFSFFFWSVGGEKL